MRLYEELTEKISQSRRYGYSPTQTQAEAVAEKGLDAMREKMNQLESQLDLKKLELERAKLRLEGWPTAAFIFNGLPSGIGRASTNADGKFSLKLPRKGRYALAAHASRKIIDDDEQYYWLVWVTVDNGTVKNVVLSNNNMMTVQSNEAVMYAALSDF